MTKIKKERNIKDKKKKFWSLNVRSWNKKLEGFTGRYENIEKRINDLEDSTVEITETEKRKRRDWRKLSKA